MPLLLGIVYWLRSWKRLQVKTHGAEVRKTFRNWISLFPNRGVLLCTHGVVLIVGFGLTGCKKKPPPAPPPPQVEVMTVSPRDVPIYKEWIGTLDGFVNAQIRAQVAGYLLKQDYIEGNQIKKGDLLFEIDPRPFEAALEQAKGKLAQDEAQFGKTQLDVKRLTPLAKANAISRQELDDAVQSNLAAQASVKADQ